MDVLRFGGLVGDDRRGAVCEQGTDHGVVGIDDGEAVRGKHGQELAVFFGQVSEGAEVLKLSGADVGQDADGGPGDLAELAYFAGVIAGQFKHGVFVPLFQASERERQAERVVVVLPAFEGGEVAGEHLRDRFLRAGFANAAGNGDDGGMPAPQDGVGVVLQRDARILDDDGCDAGSFKFGALRVCQGCDGTGLYQESRRASPRRFQQVVMPIAALSAHRDEQFARQKLARILIEGIEMDVFAHVQQAARCCAQQVVKENHVCSR